MRIQLLCDQKWRDLPGIAAIKVALEFKGYSVLVTATKEAVGFANVFRPDAVVFNHLLSKIHCEIARALSEDGRAVIVLPTEGAPRPEYGPCLTGEYSDYSNVDLILAWNESSAINIRNYWGMNEISAPVVGCTRFDFYHERFRSLLPTREEFCHRNGLKNDRPIVTWATDYQVAHLHRNNNKASWKKYEKEVIEGGDVACLDKIGLTWQELPSMYAKGQTLCAAAFFQLARSMPDVQFILRPKPIENRDYYHKCIRENNLANVSFCPEDHIWNILRATDVHLHRHCTTAIEAWMWDKPTIEMAMYRHPAWDWPEREAGSFSANTASELIDLVGKSLEGTIDDGMRNYRNDYIHKWFGPTDGNRCEVAAQLIDQVLSGRPGRSWLKPFVGFPVTKKQQLRIGLHYMLNKAPGERMFSFSRGSVRSTLEAKEKHIRRKDVLRFCRDIRLVSG